MFVAFVRTHLPSRPFYHAAFFCHRYLFSSPWYRGWQPQFPLVNLPKIKAHSHFRMDPLPPIRAWDDLHPPVERPSCPLCGPGHDLETCEQFRNLSPANRLSLILGNGRCVNCLREHEMDWPHIRCDQRARCECGAPHHPLLHESRRVVVPPPQSLGVRASFRGRRPVPVRPYLVFLHPRGPAPKR